MSELAMKLFVIPHLPVENNFRGVLAGLDDQSIHNYEECLKGLRRAIDDSRYAAVLSSPLRRSLETVTLCFDTDRTPLRVDKRLLPVDYGQFHGRTKREVGPRSYEFVDRPFPGGESYSQVAARYKSFLSEVLLEYAGREVMLMGHEGSDAVLHHLCDGGTLEELLRAADGARRKRITSGLGRVGYYSLPPVGPFVFARREPDR